MKTPPLNPTLSAYIEDACRGIAAIPTERKQTLDEMAYFVSHKIKTEGRAMLIFICTHNSRRSHLAQVWAKIASLHFGFKDNEVLVYSGGTEVTACNPRTVAALQRAGVPIEKASSVHQTNNPRYMVSLGDTIAPLYLYSKRYDDAANPSQGFCAIPVCSSADAECPFIIGAEKRIYHGYDDPKASDDTPQESATYDVRCRQIATEMLYVFKKASA
ncbi:MAG: protein-tyrosine-phosphatase [Flammeovirgaceae bacterium]|nr:protein-tyrosine-phosphatase [Flammeovirgaceae bacterium]